METLCIHNIHSQKEVFSSELNWIHLFWTEHSSELNWIQNPRGRSGERWKRFQDGNFRSSCPNWSPLLLRRLGWLRALRGQWTTSCHSQCHSPWFSLQRCATFKAPGFKSQLGWAQRSAATRKVFKPMTGSNGQRRDANTIKIGDDETIEDYWNYSSSSHRD